MCKVATSRPALSILMHIRETMLRREWDRSRIMALLRDKFRGLLEVRKIDSIPNALVRP